MAYTFTGKRVLVTGAASGIGRAVAQEAAARGAVVTVIGRSAKAGDNIDSRYHPSASMRRQLNKVFPTHWSFLLGEIAMYSFIVLLLTGVYLTLFFDPSMAEVTYNGVYQPLRGIQMSRAYETALNISFEIRGGLFVRQVHHWAALLFEQATLAEGGQLDDPAGFVKRINDLMLALSGK